MNPNIINTSSTKTIFSKNKENIVETKSEEIILSDSDIREVIKKGYLLSQITLAEIPDIIKDAINQAIIDAKTQTLSSSLIQALQDSLDNLDSGVYKKTYIDNKTSYIENIALSKVDSSTLAGIISNQISYAIENLATTSQVQALNSRVGNSESEITNVKNTINTKDLARAKQITDLEASINGTFAGYSDAIDLYVDAEGNVKSQKIETLSTNIGLQMQEVNQLIVDANNDWNAKSLKLITSPTGAITGYSFQDGSGSKSTFEINADNFKIANSTNTFAPFTITGTNLYFNGKVNFSNVTGTDSLVTSTNIQTVFNSNITTIDGGKITTNSITANKINTTGLIAENINATDIIGKNITGGTIRGARIEGAVIMASYLDLNGQLQVLTDLVISVATRNSNPSYYADAVYISADNTYRIPTLSFITEETRDQEISGAGNVFHSKLRSYNCSNAGHNMKFRRNNPTVTINSFLLFSLNYSSNASLWNIYGGPPDGTRGHSYTIYVADQHVGYYFIRWEYLGESSGGQDSSFSVYGLALYFNGTKIRDNYQNTSNYNVSNGTFELTISSRSDAKGWDFYINNFTNSVSFTNPNTGFIRIENNGGDTGLEYYLNDISTVHMLGNITANNMN